MTSYFIFSDSHLHLFERQVTEFPQRYLFGLNFLKCSKGIKFWISEVKGDIFFVVHQESGSREIRLIHYYMLTYDSILPLSLPYYLAERCKTEIRTIESLLGIRSRKATSHFYLHMLGGRRVPLTVCVARE